MARKTKKFILRRKSGDCWCVIDADLDWSVDFEVDIEGDRLAVRSMTLQPQVAGAELAPTRQKLSALPVSDMLRFLRAAIADKSTPPLAPVSEDRRAAEGAGGGSPPRLTTEQTAQRLEITADTWHEWNGWTSEERESAPLLYDLIAERLGLSDSSAKKYVARARREGLLDPARAKGEHQLSAPSSEAPVGPGRMLPYACTCGDARSEHGDDGCERCFCSEYRPAPTTADHDFTRR